MDRRLPIATLAMALLVSVATGCASLLGSRTIAVPQAQLQALIEQHFPVQKRLLAALELRLDSPRLTLEPEANRIGLEVALSVGNDSVLRSSVAGSLLVSQSLRFEPVDNTIRLTDVRVERFVVDGLPAGWQRQIDRLGKPLAEALLEDQVLYALRPNDVARLQGHGVRPADLRVTATGVSITLAPIER
ncbi:MAG: DUF1439 domain-containing protein [Pseudomonadota bacterium]|nr:DUF1439 domain-containing protein [Pseudomonadota bacterium]